MRVLIITQIVDKNDSYLGFFHGWIEEFAKHFERITVICLKEGEHTLPDNVEVYSLGKEVGTSRITRIVRFLKYIYRFRKEYDTVFVHMNQEYILLGGWIWKLLGKKIYLWRNHYSGSWRTDLATMFCTKVFCTSKFSYTAKYKKTVFMPIGINTNIFKPMVSVRREPHSILFLARMAPSKHAEILVSALNVLQKKDIAFKADFYGSPLLKNREYYESLKQRVAEMGLSEIVHFYPEIPNRKTPTLYNAYEIFVNCSPSGMFDKTIFEAAACGALSLAASHDWAALAGSELSFTRGDAYGLAQKLERLFSLRTTERTPLESQLQIVAEQNNLPTLIGTLTATMLTSST